MQTDTDRKASIWFLGVSAVYLLIQMVQRVVLGGTLESDEAEMLLLAQHWALGYGPQPPLYNWLQLLVFKVVGPGTLGLVLLKDLGLWLAGAGMWFGMRRAFTDRRAAATAALSITFLPSVLWEFQRTTSHSIALLVAVCWTFWAWFSLMERQDMRRWVVLGVLMGLGGLSKWNYWAVPIGLAVASIGLWPQRVQLRGVAASLAVAGLIVAVPSYWAVTHLSATLGSVRKFYFERDKIPWTHGLDLLFGNFLAEMALPMLIALALWAVAIRAKLGPAPMASKLLLRAAGLSLAVGAVLVYGFTVSNVQTRWLVPISVITCAGAFGWLGSALSERTFRAVPVVALVCCAITIVGMAHVRMGATGTRDISPAYDLITKLQPDRIEAGYFLAGNLKMLHPELDIRAEGATKVVGDWPKRLLLLGHWQAGLTELDSGTIELHSPVESSAPRPVHWYLAGPPA